MDMLSQSKKQSKKNIRNFLLLYNILRRIEKGMYISQIARQLNKSKQLIKYYVNKAEKDGLVVRKYRSNFVCFELTNEGKKFLTEVKKSSLLVRESQTRIHNLVIEFPILKDNPNAKWDREVEINNWIKKYSLITFPIGITIEKTTKAIIVYFHKFQTTEKMFLSEFLNWVIKGIYYVYYYLMKEKDIQIDIFSGKVIRQHIANIKPEFEKKADEKINVELSLGREAKSIFDFKEMAKAWIDRSFGNLEIETNDLIYEEKLLMMPELVYELSKTFTPAIQELTKQINLHLEIQNQHLNSIKMLQNQIEKLSDVLDKLNEKLDKLKTEKGGGKDENK